MSMCLEWQVARLSRINGELLAAYDALEKRVKELKEERGQFVRETTKVGVTALIRDDTGRILLGLKGRAFSDDFMGKWVTPGGRVNFKETLEAAMIREAMEETGVEIKIVHSLPPQEIIHKDGHFVFFAYEAQWICGVPSAGDDLLEVKWCNEEMISQMSLTPLTKIVIEYAQPTTLEKENAKLRKDLALRVSEVDALRLAIRQCEADGGCRASSVVISYINKR